MSADRSDAELIRLHAAMRKQALDRLGAPLLEALDERRTGETRDATPDDR